MTSEYTEWLMDRVSKKPAPQFGLLIQRFLRQQEKAQREGASGVSAYEAVTIWR